jgi:hypothetical protein|tara:strand:- start:2848 stop:3303 length:456 start_codon:yes stop_codon:yes gene_type:complete
MDNRIYVGIDPGKNGGIGIIYNDIQYCRKCPSTVSDMSEEIKIIMGIAPDIPKYAIIESVHSMPKQGVKSVFTFGKGYGQWLGILSAHEIPYTQVSPQKWMRFYNPLPKDKKERKNQLKHLAQQRFPNLNITLATADAMLLANFLKETHKD